MKKNKLLKNFIKISPNLKKFIDDNELWIYCPACQEEDCYEDNPYTWKVLSKYIIKNIKDNEYIFVSGGEESDFFFGDKKQIEEKINQFVNKGLCHRYESFFMIYNFIKDKEVGWSCRVDEGQNE